MPPDPLPARVAVPNRLDCWPALQDLTSKYLCNAKWNFVGPFFVSFPAHRLVIPGRWPLRISALHWLRQPYPCPTLCREALFFSFSSLSLFACPRLSWPPFLLARGACTGLYGPWPSRSGRWPVAARGAGPAHRGVTAWGVTSPTRCSVRPARLRRQQLSRTPCAEVCYGVPAPKDINRTLPSTGPPAGGVGSYSRGAQGLSLRGLLHPPTLRPACGQRVALESRKFCERILYLLCEFDTEAIPTQLPFDLSKFPFFPKFSNFSEDYPWFVRVKGSNNSRPIYFPPVSRPCRVGWFGDFKTSAPSGRLGDSNRTSAHSFFMSGGFGLGLSEAETYQLILAAIVRPRFDDSITPIRNTVRGLRCW